VADENVDFSIVKYLRNMGVKNIYERFIWFDDRVRQKKYPNTTSLAKHPVLVEKIFTERGS